MATVVDKSGNSPAPKIVETHIRTRNELLALILAK